MKVVERTESKERCAESGWYAWDCLLDAPMTPEFIKALRPLGAFVYLPMLSRPFFKIESEHFMIKGIEKNNFLRIAVHEDYPEELARVESFIEGIK